MAARRRKGGTASDRSKAGRTGERSRRLLAKPPPPPPKQARSRATRARVLAAAVACFERHGFEATTTAMIAARAGVAVGSVYNHFVDKRAIILELLAQTHRELAGPVIARLDPATWRGRVDPRERLRRLIDAIFQSQSLRPGIQRILWARYFSDTEFVAPFEAIRDALHGAIVGFLAAVEAEGHCREDLDRELAATVILNAVQWNATQAFLRDDPRHRARVARSTADLVSRYVFAGAKSGVRTIRRR